MKKRKAAEGKTDGADKPADAKLERMKKRKKPAAERFYRAMSAAQSAEYVVFDDIGVRDATDGFRGDLHSVINGRVTTGLPSVFTSNIPLAGMETVFDRRLADRMRDQTIEYSFVGVSKRGLR